MIGEAFVHLGLWLARAIARLPYPVVRRIGDAVGELLWVLARRRRRITQTNLRLCFPQWSEAQREAVARRHFRAFARSFFDRFIFWHGPPERVRALCRIEGLEHYLPHRGRPVIALAPHFVGLDAAGVRFALDFGGASVYAKQKSRAMTEAMIRGRTRFPNTRMFLRTEGLRPVLRAIREGLVLYFLPDMDLGPRDAVFVPFFGVPAATVTSVGRLAQMTGAAVMPCVTRMDDDGYVMRIHPAWQDFPGEDPVAAARRMNAFIEACVLEMPEQYLWSHRRFKTRPPGEPSVYD
jgi:KDO2-lipid IV(A) lauroyltransferase